jgi:RNA polymerase sigma factor (sigma-70 family)
MYEGRGAEREDLEQEGYLALFRIARSSTAEDMMNRRIFNNLRGRVRGAARKMWRNPENLSFDDDNEETERRISASETTWDRGTEQEAAGFELMSSIENEVGPEGAELILKLADGMSFTEIAQQEGVTPQAVWNRVKRLRKRLSGMNLR